MFIRSRSSLENHTRFQTKMGKVYSRFQTKKAQKPYPWGRHIPIWLIKESKPQTSKLSFKKVSSSSPVARDHFSGTRALCSSPSPPPPPPSSPSRASRLSPALACSPIPKALGKPVEEAEKTGFPPFFEQKIQGLFKGF